MEYIGSSNLRVCHGFSCLRLLPLSISFAVFFRIGAILAGVRCGAVRRLPWESRGREVAVGRSLWGGRCGEAATGRSLLGGRRGEVTVGIPL